MIKEIHKELKKGCYPLDPMIIYIFGIIVLVYSLIEIIS